MDELVTDLTIALERTDDPQSSKSDTTIGTKDSPSSTPVRKRKKRRGRKRRSDFPLTKDFAVLSEESNDSIEEALKDYIENISMCQSDSDEDSALTSSRRLSMLYRLASKSDPYPLPEIDSVNDTVTNTVGKRRNKKIKRSKQQFTCGILQNNTDFSGNCKSKVPRRSLKRKLSNRISGNACGETWTRRSKYEEGTWHEIDSGRSLISDHPLSDSSRYSKNVHLMYTASSSDNTLHDDISPWQLSNNDPIDEVMACSDSESSSGNESEGFFTNDEGRLGDDEGEESTFEQDTSSGSMQSVIPWWENESEELEDEQKFNNIVNGVMDAYGLSADSNSTKGGGFQARLNSIKCMHETNNMKSLVEINRKINKFLHEPLKSELSVQLTNRNEREKIYQLASLYSLHCRTENLTGGRIILIKTRNTSQPDKKALNSLLWKDGKRKGFQTSEVKRAKRMQKAPVPGVVGNLASAIPEHNIGNQMLRSMGWVPGTGLGPDKGGIVEPISATLRPRKLGLGHSWPT